MMGSNLAVPAGWPHGSYRDLLRGPDGRVRWRGGTRKNVVVVDCRRLLAGFMRGTPTNVLGIQGLVVGAGRDVWDRPPGPPPPTSDQAQLVDPDPFTVPRDSLQVDFLDGPNVTADPTNRLQVVATLGPRVPPWPDAASGHPTSTLREFGLIGELDGATVLIDYVTHLAIPKDPSSTLERTIWLTF
jgi:hypothetical protein